MRPSFTLRALKSSLLLLMLAVLPCRRSQAASPPGDRFNIAVGQVVTNGVPGVGAGALAVAQEQDVYAISAVAGQTLFFRDFGADASNIDWALFDANNQQIFRDRLDGFAPGRYSFASSGSYEIRVLSAADGSATGHYSFVVLDPQDETFNLPIGTTITNNVPAGGAGRLSVPGQYDSYSMTVSAGQKIYFQDLKADPNIDWGLYDSKNQQLFRDRLDGFSPARVTFATAGTYKIFVFGANDGSTVGNYSFAVLDAPDDVFDLAIGSNVTNGIPFAGAGNLESPGRQDLYRITVTAGQKIFFWDRGGAPNIDWALYDTNNAQIFRDRLDNFSPSRVTFTKAGTYALYVFGAGDGSATGTYGFSVLDAPDDVFDLPIGSSVTNGVPFAGAGNIETPGREDLYRITVTAGQKLYFQDLGGAPNIDWGLYDTNNQQLFRDRLDHFSPSRVSFDKSGTYQLYVFSAGAGSATGQYGFTVWNAADDIFNLPLNVTITNGVPGLGAGILETPGKVDVFNFTTTPGQTLYFNDLGADPNIDWGLYDTNNVQIFRERLDTFSPGRLDFPKGGTYQLQVFSAGDGSATGKYSISVVGVAKQEFNITLGTTVTNNIPGPGAGIIDVVGAQDVFNFEVPANRTVYFRDYGSTGPIDLALLDDTGAQIGIDRLDTGSPKNFLLAKGGKYQLIARGANDGKPVGTYSFALLLPAPVVTRQPESLSVVLGRPATLSVAADSDTPIAYQWRRNSSPIAGATNASFSISSVSQKDAGDYSVTLTNPTDTTVSANARLDIRPLVLASSAARTSLPIVPGNGVAIELFNAIGGGVVPAADALLNRTPDGSTLSPIIDFPHPGSIINVGNSFDTFFADTTTPPDVVRNLSAQNFILRHKFFLRVSRDLDQNPATPEIDFQLGVGSDDGFYLTVGTNFLGSASDRSFQYSWLPVAFESEGLYAVTLLYAANASGQSGLELSWLTARNPAAEIIPQSALYVAPNIGDQLITFEELTAGAVLGNQFANRGVIFQSTGDAQVTTSLPDRFVPVSTTHVYADPNASPGVTSELDLQFVAQNGDPAITDFVSFFILNAQNPGATVVAFNAAGGVLYSNTFHAGGASQDLVTISQSGISRVHINLGSGAAHAGLDNLSFTTPRSGADLAVGIIDASTTALPGGSFSITWAVTNVGLTEVHAPWSEKIFLVGSPNQTLGFFVASNNLAPGQSIVRTQTVTIPFIGLAGTLRAGVRVDAYDEITELDEANNSAVAATATDIPLTLTLDTADANTMEGAVPLAIKVTRNGDTSGPLTVALLSSNPAEVLIPTNVVFAPSQSTAQFNFNALADGVVDGTKILDLTASANNYSSGTLAVVVRDADTPKLGLSFASASITEGGTLRGTISRPLAAPTPLTIFVRSSLPARTQFPDSIVITAGATNVNFEITALRDGIATSPRRLTATAEAVGYLASNPVTLSVIDSDLPPVTLTLSRQTINEGDGARAAIVTLSRPTAAASDLLFEVISSDTNSVRVPASVVIANGDATASFPIAAVDDAVLNPSRTITLSVYPVDPLTSEHISEPLSANLTVSDNDGPSLTLAVGRRLVGKALTPATTATVTRRGPVTSPVTVTLSSDRGDLVSIPSILSLGAGQASGIFSINTLDDFNPGTTKVVNLSASAPGLAGGGDSLIVSDVSLPDLVVTNVSGPFTADTESFVGVTYRVLNQGFASFTTNVLTRIFLSTSPGTGNDLFAGNFTFTGSIPPNEFFEQTLQVRLPTQPGDYYVIATTDLEDNVPEILENNNTGISAVPIHVQAAYTATATTEASIVPAGTAVTFRGRAFKANSIVPAPQVPVHLHLVVRDTRRVLLAVTDDDGNYSVTFTPLPNEAGNYGYAAAHPGVAEPPIQGHFTIVGLRGRVPESPTQLIENAPLTLQIPLENLSDQPLNGLQARLLSGPANVTATPSLPTSATLPGSGSLSLSVTLRATDTRITSSNVVVRVTSTEGATSDITLPITVESHSPRLVTNPPELVAGMKRGFTTTFAFDLVNSGGSDTGPITVLAPDLPWLRVLTPTPLPSIAAGQSNRISLQFSPASDLPLGDYKGTFVLRAGTLNVSIPFNFRALSEAKGDLRITAVDEYTYYAEGAPPVTNAAVRITDAITGLVLTNGVTDLNGQFTLPQVFEGYYDVLVSADQHISYHETSLVLPGVTNEVQAFLSRETVRYIWTVEPTEIEDRTKITIETEFETFVPIPVVTIEPAVIDLAEITAEVTQINLRISNHGLLAANDFKLNFSSHPEWQLEPLVTEFGSLPARSSLVVPLTIRHFKPGQSANFRSLKSAGVHALAAAPCGIYGGGTWNIVCGTKKTYSSPIQITGVGGNCTAGAGGWGGNGSVGAPYVSGPTFAVKTDCSTNNDCINLQSPDIDVSGILKPLAKAATTAANAYLAAQPWNFFLGLELDVKPEAKAKAGLCCKDGKQDWNLSGEVSGEVSVSSKKFNIDRSETVKFDNFDIAGQTGALELTTKVFLGTKAVPSFKVGGSYKKECGKDKPVYEVSISGGVQIKSGLEATAKGKFTVAGVPKDVTVSDIKGGLAGGLTFSLTLNSEGEKKLCYKSDGMYLFGSANVAGKTAELFTGGKLYLIDPLTDCSSFSPIFREALELAEAEMNAHLRAEGQRLMRQSNGSDEGGGGVCARIRLKLDQDLFLTRNAFDATLEVLNNDPINPIENVLIQVGILDNSNNPAGERFDVETNRLDGLTAVDGTGLINRSAKGTASFLIIPGRDAAPDQATIYKVGGLLTYTQAGRKLVVPLSPVPITVLPDPRLLVKYFHQRDVYSDDPFTPVIEPSVPYSLAVMIQNVGQGDAKNVRITSAQPQIVDNEKGLLIDFKIIGTDVSGEPATPSLTVDFGSIPAGTIGIGRWLLTSTLQGLFDTYSATIEHTAGPQEKRSSLIDDLSIHEMIHLVEAPAPFQDGRPDFLVNDTVDPDALPDTLYLSNGATNSVSVVRDASVNGTVSSNSLSVQITASMPDDWTYLRILDPARGNFRLKRVVRSDNHEIAFGTNAWATDRTFIGKGRKPIRENLVHIFDYKSTGAYTLFYDLLPPIEAIPPSSKVDPLPANSYAQIPVSWAGSDNPGGSGINFYDIYVSIDGAPFVPWIQHSDQTGSVYSGQLGKKYAFYSVATDNVGNREADHTSSDTQTTVSLENHAPTFAAIGDRRLDEGDLLTIQPVATDPDSDVLTWSFVGATPPGLQINPASGLITWLTGAGLGPSTNRITVQVLDNGIPRLGALRTFNVILDEHNFAPEIQALGNQTIREGQLLRLTNVVNDPDWPAQNISFKLANAPQGAAIDPASGVLTWRPDDIQGGSNYVINVVATDSGTPSLTSTQSLRVAVLDTRADFTIQLGSTNVTAGAGSYLPIFLQSATEITNVVFDLTYPNTRVTHLTLQPLSASVGTASLENAGSNKFIAHISALAGAVLPANGEIARLLFLADTNESTVLTFNASNAQATRSNGSPLVNGGAVGAPVFLVRTQPLLGVTLVNRSPQFALYSPPPQNFELQFKTNLNQATWTTFATILSTNQFTPITAPPGNLGHVFIRVHSLSAKGSRLILTSGGDFFINGQSGESYVIQSRLVQGEQSWRDEFSIVLTNSTMQLPNVPKADSGRLYRSVQPKP